MITLNDLITRLINLVIVWIFISLYLYLIFEISLYKYQVEMLYMIAEYRYCWIVFISLIFIYNKKFDSLLNFYLIINLKA